MKSMPKLLSFVRLALLSTTLLFFTSANQEPDSLKSLNEKMSLYTYVGDFCDGLADVTLDNKSGFIDRTGEEVIPCRYTSASSFSDGLAKVVLDGKYVFISNK